MYAYENATII